MTTDLIEMREVARRTARALDTTIYASADQKKAASVKNREKSRVSSLTAELGRMLRQLDLAHTAIARQEARIEQLEVLATTDELTRLDNRRGFYNAFSTELARCRRGLSDGGLLVMIDLDNFKSINDIYGHAAGDACLRLVAQTLRDEVRPTDTAARLGGDEFVLLLTGADKDLAAARVQTMAWQLNHLALNWEGRDIAVHASVGIRGYASGDTPECILNAADTAMYASKKMKSAVAAAVAVPA